MTCENQLARDKIAPGAIKCIALSAHFNKDGEISCQKGHYSMKGCVTGSAGKCTGTLQKQA